MGDILMKASEVFTPGSTPKYTYYDRPEQDLENQLLRAVETKGFITSISGPSKCGKTVLCESVLGKKQERMLLIPGGGISSEYDFWNRLRIELDLPSKIDSLASVQHTEGTSTQIGAKAGIPGVITAQGDLSANGSVLTSTSQVHTHDGMSGPQMLGYLRTQGIRLVVDDFHYVAFAAQKALAQQFKEAARQGTTIVLVSISERSDQAIRANPDLRGRLLTIDIPYWTTEELKAIPQKGFKVLNVDAHPDVVNLFTTESVGSPQLMQALCLELCHFWKLEEPFPSPRSMTCPSGAGEKFLRKTSALANCKTAFDMLRSGPKPHGSPRKGYKIKNGAEGDIYALLLRAIAHGKPTLTLNYQEIMARISELVDEKQVSGVVKALIRANEIVEQKLQTDRVLEWDGEKNVLNILDPYFLFYLRWSDVFK